MNRDSNISTLYILELKSCEGLLFSYEFLKKSEEKNDGNMRSDSGYFFMGEVYYFGISVPQDWEKAKGYYLKVIEIYGTGDYYWRACERISAMSTYILESL